MHRLYLAWLYLVWLYLVLLTMALLATYQVRELSTSAVELWALRALRGEVIITRSTTYYLLPTT